MVIADPAIVEDAGESQALRGARRGVAGEGRERGEAVGEGGEDGGDLAAHVGGEMARIGAGIAEELVLLVERLRDVQGALRREAKAAVGGALERREIEEERRRLALGDALDALDGGGLASEAGDEVLAEPGREPGAAGVESRWR